MNVRDYYKEHYFLEATRRNELTNALSIPLGILSLLIGGLTVIARGIHLPLSSTSILLLALMTVAVVFILRTVYFLIRSYYNYEYGYAPTPLEIKTYKEELIAYYLALGESPDAAIQKAESEALQHVDAEYAAHADRNAKNNNRKSSFMHNANSALIGAIIFTLPIVATYLVTSIRTVPEPQKVEIVNLKETTMTEQTSNSSPKAPATPPATPKPDPAPVITKPSPPPGQILKEHVDPKSK